MNATCVFSINEEPYILISQEYTAHALAIKVPLQSPCFLFFFLSTVIASALLPVVGKGCEAVFQHHIVPLTDLNSSSHSTPAVRLLTCRTSDKSKLNKELCRTLFHTEIS